MIHRTALTLVALAASLASSHAGIAAPPTPPGPADAHEDAPPDVDDADGDGDAGDEGALTAPEDDAYLAPEGDGYAVPEDDREALDDEVLETDDGYELRRGVTIEHRRREILRSGGSVQALDAEQLEAQEYDDPESVLVQVPSVQSRGEDGYGLRPNIGIRGVASERSKKVTLMEDGVLFGPAPYAAPAAYYFPLMTRMVGVEVFKGPAAITYGPHTIGGAIDLAGRPIPYKLEMGADLAIGTDLYLKGHGHAGATHFFDGAAGVGLLVEGTHLQSDGFKSLDGGGDTGFSRSEVAVKGRLHSDLDAPVTHQLDAAVVWSREDSDETYLGLTDEDFRASPLRRYRASALDHMAWSRLSGRLDYTLVFGDLDEASAPAAAPRGGDGATRHRVEIKLTGYRHAFERAWRKVQGFRQGPLLDEVLANPRSGSNELYYRLLTGAEDTASPDEAILLQTNDRAYVSQGLQLIARGALDDATVRHEVELGLRLHYDEVERDHYGDYYDMRDGALVRDGTPRETVLQNVGSALAFAGHLRYGLRWRGLSVTPGLRIEAIETELTAPGGAADQTNSTVVALAGLGVHYEIVDGLGVLAGVHRGFSPVAPGQDDAVEPELSVNYEAGVRYGDAVTGTLAEVIVFFNDYSNLTGQCSFSSGCDPEDLDAQFNAGEVDVYGAEVVGRHRLDLGAGVHMPLRLAYTFTQSSFRTGFVSDNPQFGTVEPGDELPYLPTHQLSLAVGVGMARWGVDAVLAIVSPMREEAGQGDADDDMLTDTNVALDVMGRVTLFDGIQAYVRLENLLMREELASRRPYGARPGKPFMAQVGVKLDY